MKISLFFLLCISFSVAGQGKRNPNFYPDNKTLEMVFKDFDEGFENTSLMHLKRSQAIESNYVFELSGYNSVLFTPIVKITPMNYKSVVPDPVKSFVSLADFSRESDLGTVTPNEVSPPSESKLIAQRNLEQSTTRLTQIKKQIDSISKNEIIVKRKFETAKNKSKDDPLKSQEINYLNKRLEKLDKQKSQLQELEESIKAEISVQKSILSSLTALELTINKFNTALSDIKNTVLIIDKLREDLKNTKNDVDRCVQLRDIAYTEIAKLYDVEGTRDLILLQRNFTESLYACIALKESILMQISGGFDEQNIELQTAANEALVASESIATNKEVLTTGLKSFLNLFPTDTTKKSARYVHKNDYALISIKLINNLNPKDTVLKQQIKISTKGGFDVDFSLGLLYNSIYKKTWYVDTVGDNRIAEEKVFRADLATAGLIDFSYRLSASARAGLSLGAGVSLLDGGARYLIGPHLFLGSRDLVGISGGLVFAKKNFLPSTLSSDGRNPNENIPEALTSVTTYEKFARGFYCGLFYNFSRK